MISNSTYRSKQRDTRRVCTYASQPPPDHKSTTMSDVPMEKPANEKKQETKVEEKVKDTKPEEAKKEPPSVPVEIRANSALIDRAVSTLEPRYTLRVLRTLAALRKRLNTKALADAVDAVYPLSTRSLCIPCAQSLHPTFVRLCQQTDFTSMASNTRTRRNNGR